MTNHQRMQNAIDGKTILLTGGTGSFGKAFITHLLTNYSPRTIRIYSRDELKQFHLREELQSDKLRFFIGDVRDKDRLIKAARQADIIIHAAAMKQVPACEYNPFEAVKTNIIGATNIVDAALANDVPHTLALSTDKAVNPVNLYGATKLCSDKIFIHANAYSGDRPTRFSLVRYGNILGSRGSVIPLFKRQKRQGFVTITDKRMTRFWLTLEQAIDLVLRSLTLMHGGEIFIPEIPSMKVTELAEVIAPGCEQRETGIRAGEKIHEILINEDEGRRTVKKDNLFIVLPTDRATDQLIDHGGVPVAENFVYSSDRNSAWLDKAELEKLLLQCKE